MKLKPMLQLWTLPVLSIFFLLYIAWLRSTHALVHAFDTGLYLQILNNFMQNGDFASSIVGESNFMAHHFQPIIVLLAPLVAISSTPMTLFLVSTVSILASITIFLKYTPVRRQTLFIQFAFIMTIIWHPTTANRIFFSFVPEIMALPFLIGQACLLYRAPLSIRKIILLFALQIAAGICKENIWLVNLIVCVTLAYMQRDRRWLFAVAGLINFAIFAGLFFYWMPKNSDLPAYYAMRYYQNPAVEIVNRWTLLQAMFLNVFSSRSFLTFFYMALSTAFIGLLVPSRATLAAGAGIGMILAASHSLVHILGNQYFLLSLPFIWVATAYHLQKPFFSQEKAARWIGVILILAPMYMTLAGDFGIHLRFETVRKYPYTKFITRDLTEIKNSLKPESKLLVDGNLSTYLAEYRNTKNILNFTGNPYQVSTEDMNAATDVVTSVDLRELPGGCSEVNKGNSTDILEYNYDNFHLFCNWLVANKMTVKKYPESRLYHYSYAP